MDEAYARAYGRLARGHWWWRARDRAVANALASRMTADGSARILDIGSGDGRLFPLFARFGTIEGIEPDANGATGHPAEGVIHRVPFAEPLPTRGPYDVITMLDVLEHLEDPVSALRLAASLLAPEGWMLITVPAHMWLWTRHDELNHHQRRFSRGSLSRVLEAAGLTPRTARYLFHALIVPKLMVHLKERLVPGTARVPRIPPAGINRGTELFFRAETILLRPVAGWLPGSSLLVIAARSSATASTPPGIQGGGAPESGRVARST
jgi:2-polyprenyl-3-methyl-5-hydroxy-6-metoxy-1,4-benzoquinol methylase